MKNGNKIIQSLDRGLFLLDAIAESSDDISLKELKERLDIDKSSVFRLLATLINKGYVEQDNLTKRYRLGLKILAISSRLYTRLKVNEQARPCLKELASKTGETSHLALCSNYESVLIDQEIGSELVSVNTQIGRREPLHATALGKVLLASFSKEEFEAFVSSNGIAQYTPNTKISKAAFKKEIEKVRKTGFAIDDEEYKEGIRCIASPVRDSKGLTIAAIGISGPKERITKYRIHDLAKVVKEIAKKVSSRLGFNEKGGYPRNLER
jgi:DNA-binding IclR family transcriptional regulator